MARTFTPQQLKAMEQVITDSTSGNFERPSDLGKPMVSQGTTLTTRPVKTFEVNDRGEVVGPTKPKLSPSTQSIVKGPKGEPVDPTMMYNDGASPFRKPTPPSLANVSAGVRGVAGARGDASLTLRPLSIDSLPSFEEGYSYGPGVEGDPWAGGRAPGEVGSGIRAEQPKAQGGLFGFLADALGGTGGGGLFSVPSAPTPPETIAAMRKSSDYDPQQISALEKGLSLYSPKAGAYLPTKSAGGKPRRTSGDSSVYGSGGSLVGR